MAKTLLSPDQVAEQLGVSRTTVLLWADERGLPCIRFSKRTIRFDPAAVELWLESISTSSGVGAAVVAAR